MDTQEGNTIPEIWKAIPDWPGYEVSDQGRVRSYWKRIFPMPGEGCDWIIDGHPQRILKQGMNQEGYAQVGLTRDGKRHTFTVHGLVLRNFVGPRPKGFQSCHEDGVRTNSTLKNLRYDTGPNNHQDRHKHGTAPIGGNNNRSHLTDAKVLKIRELHAHGGYTYPEIAKMFDVTKSAVDHIVHRRTWTHLP